MASLQSSSLISTTYSHAICASSRIPCLLNSRLISFNSSDCSCTWEKSDRFFVQFSIIPVCSIQSFWTSFNSSLSSVLASIRRSRRLRISSLKESINFCFSAAPTSLELSRPIAPASSAAVPASINCTVTSCIRF